MTETDRILKGIVDILQEGLAFYREAASATGAVRRLYAEVMSLVRDPDAVYVDQLEDNENELLRRIDEALQGLPNGPARDAVALIHENFTKTHATMASLKQA